MKKSDREIVWNKYDKHCAYCGCDLEYGDMQVDHFICKANYHKYAKKSIPEFLHHLGPGDLDHMDNMMPSCRQCNYYKSSSKIEGFRKAMKSLHERIMKPFISRLGAKYGIIKIQEWDGIFYYEKYNEV